MSATYEQLCAAADAEIALCAYHPCPPAKPGSLLKPRGCSCYSRTAAFIAFMNWRSPVCDICGGRERCKSNCTALDRRF